MRGRSTMGAMPRGSPYELDLDEMVPPSTSSLLAPTLLPLSPPLPAADGEVGGVSSHTEVDDAIKCQPRDALPSAPRGRTRAGCLVAASSVSVATNDADARRSSLSLPSDQAALSRLSRTSRWRREWYDTEELELVDGARGRRLGETGTSGFSRPEHGGRRSCMTTEGSGSTGRFGRTKSLRLLEVVGIILLLFFCGSGERMRAWSWFAPVF